MDDSWRFRPIQPSLSAYPYPPPPPHQNPIYNPFSDPNSLSNQSQYRQQTSFPESDGSRKRMRVEDPHQFPPSSGITIDDQWRLNMIRDYGRHDASVDEKIENAGNPGFNPQIGALSSYNNTNHYDSFRPPLENKTSPYNHHYGDTNPYNDYCQSYSYSQRPTESQLKTFDGTKKMIDSAYNVNGAKNNGRNGYNGHPQTYCPPLPPNPPPPQPSPPPCYYERPSMWTSLPNASANLFPITQQKTQSSYFHATTPLPVVNNSQNMMHSNYYGDIAGRASTGFVAETPPFVNHHTPSNVYSEGRAKAFPPTPVIKDKPIIVDACQLFKHPHRTSRPDHFVVIIRGLPGSGKSYMAKALRDLEVESGGNAPRIHSMDDYFMIEVEKKVEENEGSKATASSRGKKQITKKVIEYCFEPEMEEAYRSSMLKAFKKTLDEGNYRIIIVDDRNLRVADFAQFWAIAKRSGYEVYLLEAAYKDPAGCAARNVHGFTEESIRKMAEQWEDASSLYLQLDIRSLFREDDLCSQSIQEVDMDTDDMGSEEEQNKLLHQGDGTQNTEPEVSNHIPDVALKYGDRWDEEEESKGVNDLSSSKWSKDEDEEEDNSKFLQNKPSALTGLIQAYTKKEKSVHWGDQVKKSGFSIGAVKKPSNSSLVIGPGSGYNLSSNPLPENEYTAQQNGSIKETKRRFRDQLQAERESFKAVFDQKRRRHIGGGLWDTEDE